MLLFRYIGCYSWPGLKANPIEAAHVKLVPPHTWQLVEFKLGKFLIAEVKALFLRFQGRLGASPLDRKSKHESFHCSAVGVVFHFFEGVANETKSFPKGRIHIY